MSLLGLWKEEIFEGKTQTGWCVTIEYMGTHYSVKTWGGIATVRQRLLQQVASNLRVPYVPLPCHDPDTFCDQLRELRGLVEQAFYESQNKQEE